MDSSNDGRLPGGFARDARPAPNLEHQPQDGTVDDYLDELVDGWPPLTARQLADLSAILATAQRGMAA